MEFGLHLGTRGAAMDPAGLAALAERAESLGFTHLGISDHVVLADKVDSPYPYTKTGKWFAQDTGECLDQLTTLAYVAARTSTLRLLTSVMVLPHRHAVLTAKMLATIDHLSSGRLTVGVGVGWMAEEIALLGAPTFERRGQMADEYIDAFRALWEQDRPQYAGDFVNFDGVLFAPKPTQTPLPIWIGGETKPARRRAGRLGDGWYPVGNNPTSPFDTAARFERGVLDVRQIAEQAGRDPGLIDLGLYVIWYRLGDPEITESGQRRPFTGDAADIIDDIGAYAAAGLQHLVIGFETNELSVALDHIERFSSEIMSKV